MIKACHSTGEWKTQIVKRKIRSQEEEKKTVNIAKRKVITESKILQQKHI